MQRTHKHPCAKSLDCKTWNALMSGNITAVHAPRHCDTSRPQTATTSACGGHPLTAPSFSFYLRCYVCTHVWRRITVSAGAAGSGVISCRACRPCRAASRRFGRSYSPHRQQIRLEMDVIPTCKSTRFTPQAHAKHIGQCVANYMRIVRYSASSSH